MTLLGWLVVALHSSLAVIAGGHALLTRSDSRAAWGWIAACWLFPLGGALLYYLLGSNRIQRRARQLAGYPPQAKTGAEAAPLLSGVHHDELHELMRIGRAMARRPLRAANQVEPLFNGEQAYPAMLESIRGATTSVCLTTYLFGTSGASLEFVEALAAAHERGVSVYVILDGVGDLYNWPPASRLLRERGVRTVLFHPPRLLPPMLHINLRNHRKLLVVDGTVGFVGGMNVGDRNLVKRWGAKGIRDAQFRVTGPAVADLQDVFRADWLAASGESLPAMPEPRPAHGAASCRVMTDGPDHDLDRLVMVLLGALANAHKTVRIMTPYFLPPAELAGALQSAALRGVDVRVVIPERSNEPWVDWAARRGLSEPLRNDVKIRERPPPFAHTKLFIVDDYYVQVGSANLDARSLRLNFELMLEAYDRPLAATLSRHFDDAWAASRPFDAAQLAARPFWKRLRDSFFWLFSAYF